MLKNGRDWLESNVRTGDGYVADFARRVLRHWKFTAAVIVGFVAIGVGGYAIGASRVGDADNARQAGVTAGEKLGTSVGTGKGYVSAFNLARERAYAPAYREAYRTAYRDAFGQADLAVPNDLKVSGP